MEASQDYKFVFVIFSDYYSKHEILAVGHDEIEAHKRGMREFYKLSYRKQLSKHYRVYSISTAIALELITSESLKRFLNHKFGRHSSQSYASYTGDK